MTALRAAAAAALVAFACGSGGGDTAAATQPRVVVETAAGARHLVDVELARTNAERMRGLMNRPSLAENAGMLFVFEAPAVHSFWMKNTLIPLDMIFIDDGGTIVGIVESAQPRSLEPRSVGKPSRYVLEVNGGWCKARGVRAGDRVRFENVPRF